MADLFATFEAAIAKADRTIAGEIAIRRPTERDPLVDDPDWEEDERLDAWRAVVYQTRTLPPTLAVGIAADAGLKDHDRWLTARTLLARKLSGRRSTSRLPALLDYVLTRPIVSAGMIAEELKITPRAAQDLVGSWVCAR